MKRHIKIWAWILCFALIMPGISMPVYAAESQEIEDSETLEEGAEEDSEETILTVEEEDEVISDNELDIVTEETPTPSEEPVEIEATDVSEVSSEDSTDSISEDELEKKSEQILKEDDKENVLFEDNSDVNNEKDLEHNEVKLEDSLIDNLQNSGTWFWPVPGHSGISQYYSNSHKAIDITAASGTPIYATKSGTVRLAINDCSHEKVGKGQCVHNINGYNYSDGGNQVYLAHDDGTHSVYAHMIKGSVLVRAGQYVSAGQQIGQMGQSGYSTGVHLHFGISIGGSTYYNGTITDPFAVTYGNSSGTPTSLLRNDGVTEITNSTAKISASLPSAYNISEAGFYYGTSPDNMAKVVEATSGSTITAYYTLGNGKWCGPLSPGTTYYYKIYVIINGVTHESAVDSFTTTGGNDPIGNLDSLGGGLGHFWLSGWALDKDSPTTPLDIHVYVGSGSERECCAVFNANTERTDVSAVHPEAGANHGFANVIYTNKTGYQNVEVFAINISGGTNNTQIGSGTVYIESDTSVPQINKVWYSNITNSSFKINASISDNVGVTAVRFPTWRAGQTNEEVIWFEGTKQPDGTWAVVVDANNWECMESTYYTHVYAYDAAGNYSLNNTLSLWLDRTAPAVRDVKAERISENIVKVSCIAEDYATDVERVVFPTWTDYNGQDDMVADWNNYYKGKKDGNKWTWYVYDSEHNYEKGSYTTHIYAYDTYGNYKKEKVFYSFANRFQPTVFTYNGNRYEVYDDILTWSQAKAKCEALGGHLVTITSQGEQKAIAEAIQSGVRDGFFMGGTTVNGVPTWITGEKFDYTNWNPGEPNNSGGTKDAYHIWRKGKWDDTVAESYRLGFICEYEAPKGFWVEEIGDYIYTGKAIKPTVKVYDGTTLLSANKDYTVAYINNIAVNNASNKKTAPTITVTGKGNYSGNQSIYFKIEPADISGDDFSINNMTATYTGKKQTPIPKLMWKDKMLEYGKDFYIPEYDNAKNDSKAFKSAGKYQLTVIGKKNFTGTISSTLTISQSKKHIAINKVTVSGIKDVNWTGKQRTQTGFKLNYGNDILSVKNGDFTVAWGTNVDVGTGTVTFRGTGLDTDGDGYCYVGAKSVSFKIKGTLINDATVSGLKKKYTYTGNQIEPDTILKYKAKNGKTDTLVEGIHYKVTYKNNINKGTATITYQGLAKGGFTGTKKVTFEISAKGIATKLVDGNKVKQIEVAFTDTGNMQQGIYIAPYMKGGAKPQIKVTCGDKVLVKGKDYTVSYENNKKVALSTNSALPAVVIKGKGNYSGTYKEPFFIRKKPLLNSNGITVVASDKVVSTKKNGYRQNFKVYDSDGVLLESNDYDTKNVTYTLIKTPDKNGTIIDVNQQLNKNSIVPANSIIRITVRGKGAYSEGEATGTYRILEKGHNISSATIQIKNQTYTGSQILITDQSQFINGKVYVVSGNIKKELMLGKDIEVVPGSYSNNIKAGTAKVKFRGINEYGGVKTVTFKIVSKKIKWL